MSLLTIVIILSTGVNVARSQPGDTTPMAAEMAACADVLSAAESAVLSADPIMLELISSERFEACGHMLSLHEETATTDPGPLTELVLDWAELIISLESRCYEAQQILGRLSHALDVLPSESTASFGRVARLSIACDGGPVASLGGDATLPSSVTQSLSGITFGGDAAHDRFGGSCVGWVSHAPNHSLEVTEAGSVSVEVHSVEGYDLTLVLSGPSGTFCNDDFHGLNPALSEDLDVGVYQVWIGELFPSDYGSNYDIQFRSGALNTALFGDPPQSGEVTLDASTRDAQELRGVAGGSVLASRFGSHCVGNIPEQPNHRVHLPEEGRVSVQVSSDGSQDLVLVVAGPEGTYCNDDFDGVDPGLSEILPAGDYDVYVGTWFAGVAPDYVVVFSSQNLSGALVGAVPPINGAFVLGPGRERVDHVGYTSGEFEARSVFDPSCSGWVSNQPTHSLDLIEASDVWIRAGSPGGDLTLVLVGSDGIWCNDDRWGFDPGLHETLAAGRYDLFVGEFALTPYGTAYGIEATLLAPAGEFERLTPPDPILPPADGAEVVAWGAVRAERDTHVRFGDETWGYIEDDRSHQLVLDVATDVVVSVVSLGDPILLIHGPGGVHFSDDSDGLLPIIEARLDPGTHDIYVGSFSFGYAQLSYTLYVTGVPVEMASIATDPVDPTEVLGVPDAPPRLELPLPADVTGVGPPDPRFATFTISPDADALQRTTGSTDGTQPGSRFGRRCNGQTADQPEIGLFVTVATELAIRVQAGADTTLVVAGPNGPFCNDDMNGVQPGLDLRLEPGYYEVYVGTFSSRSTNYELTVERR